MLQVLHGGSRLPGPPLQPAAHVQRADQVVAGCARSQQRDQPHRGGHAGDVVAAHVVLDESHRDLDAQLLVQRRVLVGDGQCFAQHRAGLGLARVRSQHRGQVGQRAGTFSARAGEGAPGQRHRGGIQCDTALVVVHLAVHLAQHTHDTQLGRRRVVQSLVDALGSGIQQFFRGALAGLDRVGLVAGVGAEDVLHEGLHRLRGARLGLRDAALRLRTLRLLDRHGAGTQHNHRDRHRRGHRGPVAGHELAQPVPRAVGPRQHRLAGQPALQVIGHGVDGGVPLGRCLLQRLADDGVQVGRPVARPSGGLDARRLFVQHRVFGGPARGARERPLAGQQLVGQHAQRPDVDGDADHAPAELLGCCVVQRHRAAAQACQLGLGGRALVVLQQLGDAEVQQHRAALRRDEHVAGFQVAVDDEVGMRELHRVHHLQQQLHALAGTELAGGAVRGDGLAFDVFQRQVGLPVVGLPGVVQPRDVRVHERTQDVALARKTLHQHAALQAQHRQLQRHRALEHAVGALGQPDLAHAALAEHAEQAVRADGVAALEAGGVAAAVAGVGFVRGGQRQGRPALEQIGGRCLAPSGQQFTQPRRQAGGLAAQALQPRLDGGRVDVHRLVEQGRQALQVGGGQVHGAACALIGRRQGWLPAGPSASPPPRPPRIDGPGAIAAPGSRPPTACSAGRARTLAAATAPAP